MKITKVNIPESEAKKYGLKHIKMGKLNSIVLGLRVVVWVKKSVNQYKMALDKGRRAFKGVVKFV